MANTELILSTGFDRAPAGAGDVSATAATPLAVSSAPARSRGALAIARDLFALTKPRITALVLATEAAGVALAPGHVAARVQCLSLVGTTLIVGSANSLNMWWELFCLNADG